VPAVPHHLEREVDRMSYVANGGHTTRVQLRALHDARIELDVTFEVEARADACVE
jgi:hypothetical protein